MHPPDAGRRGSDANDLAEAERSHRPFLVFRDADDRQRLFFLEAGSPSVSVGRRPESDLVLAWDDQVSRQHARFERSDDGWVLIDDGPSSNGTFVNEERLEGRRKLQDGDVLRFGATAATFRSPTRPEQNGAQPPAAVSLSTNQRRVLEALSRPYSENRAPATDQEIADELVLSASEVRGHLRVLYAKLGVDGASDPRQLIERAVAAGLL
jgi:pSer/pThr/pTyr-binding forkhead associated (FHA) protein